MNAFADEIRVRIRSPRLENEFFTISSDDTMKLFYHQDGTDQPIMPLPSKMIHLRVNGYYSSHENYRFYNTQQLSTNIGPYGLILTDYRETNYESIKKRQQEIASQFGLKTYIYTNGNSFQLWTGQYLTLDAARNARDSIRQDYDLNVIINDNIEMILLYNHENDLMVALANDYRFFIKNDHPDRNYVNIDGKPYRGSVGGYIIEGNRLLSINKVAIEAYLKGVVASEMPASWPLEALKVQAIAARSYALSLIGPIHASPYDAQDNQNSQVYNGIWGERESTNKAVEETKGQLIYYNDTVIAAYYHSTSGGSTDNSENVWRNPLPYIRGVDDPYSNISPYTEWHIALSEEKLLSALRENGYRANKIYDIYEKNLSEFNRVLELAIVTDIGEIILEKEETRTVLGYSNLRSTWYAFEGNQQASIMTANGLSNKTLGGQNVLTTQGYKPILYKTEMPVLTANGTVHQSTSPDSYDVYGRGFGHGLGLSQYGARGMADAGYNYIEIIQYYYTGVEVK